MLCSDASSNVNIECRYQITAYQAFSKNVSNITLVMNRLRLLYSPNLFCCIITIVSSVADFKGR